MKKFWMLYCIALVTYIAGICLPILLLEQVFGIFNNEQSILSGLGMLVEKHEFLLFLVIGVFSVVFPVLKFCAMAVIAKKLQNGEGVAVLWVERLESAGRWSMLDVFVVAQLVVFVKLGSLANVTPKLGVVFFAASVILAMLSSINLKKLVEESSFAMQEA